MEVKILQLLEGARDAEGLAVIIDVFRAFSVACYVVGNGATRIIPLDDIEKAREMKRKDPSSVLIGERGGKQITGFDYGNSPTQIEDVDFTDTVVIHTTSAGTKGLMNAKDADEIITGSFVNVQAVVDYSIVRNPDVVSLVCMGDAGFHQTDEDTLCAEYIQDMLQGKGTDFTKIIEHLRGYETAQKFFDPEKDWAPERDFELCMALNRFDFVLRAGFFGGNILSLRKVHARR
jgi:2-phosphosulfolactate phosphatase